MPDERTDDLVDILNDIEHPTQLQSYVEEHTLHGLEGTVADFLCKKIEDKGLTKKLVVRKSGIYRTYAYQILQGTRRPSRDKLLAFCIGMQLTLNETQHALTIASEGILYAKDKRDAIIIFSINKQLDVIATNALLFDMGVQILE